MHDARTVAWPVPFFFGGRTCLDFVNTVNSRSRPVTKDYLSDYAALLGWSGQVDFFDAPSLERLRTLAEADGRGAEAAHVRAIRFRETLFALFRSVIEGCDPPEGGLAELSRLSGKARQQQRLAREPAGFVWNWDESRLDLDAPLHAVVLCAEAMLTGDDLGRLKACPGPDGCGWLFFDETKNASRRWCSMDHCGGTAKARRHAARTREKRA
ncbi:CGNR zinc finger domain-containing protein [Nitratireductor aquibiodomus]|uniref:CGNR zinc finger domain-containing protein n=1 Tax=Nitratireductor aquibiodomus TaxID=204799 RepID=UPI00046A6619|nr:ABATE domain-containing protein [Nitratireductor aquibiodomus]